MKLWFYGFKRKVIWKQQRVRQWRWKILIIICKNLIKNRTVELIPKKYTIIIMCIRHQPMASQRKTIFSMSTISVIAGYYHTKRLWLKSLLRFGRRARWSAAMQRARECDWEVHILTSAFRSSTISIQTQSHHHFQTLQGINKTNTND